MCLIWFASRWYCFCFFCQDWWSGDMAHWWSGGVEAGRRDAAARWAAKESKTHARPELYASTPPLEALKVVLSEIATSKCGGKVVPLVDVRRAYFNAPVRRRVFVELPPEDYQAGDAHMCGLLQYSLYGTRDAAQNWQEELSSTLSDLKLTRGVACLCVWRGHIKGEHVATVHGDDITIGGDRSAVELHIRKISRKYQEGADELTLRRDEESMLRARGWGPPLVDEDWHSIWPSTRASRDRKWENMYCKSVEMWSISRNQGSTRRQRRCGH